MIEQNTQMFSEYLDTLVNRTYAVLCLYEEKNEGLFKYIQSLVYELHGLSKVIHGIEAGSEYITLLATLESLSCDATINFDKKDVVKREVFKCISIIKKMRQKSTGCENNVMV